jgi:hypothetical protein
MSAAAVFLISCSKSDAVIGIAGNTSSLVDACSTINFLHIPSPYMDFYMPMHDLLVLK